MQIGDIRDKPSCADEVNRIILDAELRPAHGMSFSFGVR